MDMHDFTHWNEDTYELHMFLILLYFFSARQNHEKSQSDTVNLLHGSNWWKLKDCTSKRVSQIKTSFPEHSNIWSLLIYTHVHVLKHWIGA
jgi:hypothetical protein